MDTRYNPTSVLQRRYIVQVPRKRPTGENVWVDKQRRTWIKASDYNVGNFAMWEEENPHRYYVWYSSDNVPEEGEVVFENYEIETVYRVGRLLRCVVELVHI